MMRFVSSYAVEHAAKLGLEAPRESVQGDPIGESTIFDVLTAGKHSITLKNQGPQPHEANLIKVASGVTVDAILKMATATSSPPPGPPPWTDVGGTGAISQGLTATFEANLQPGEYAFLCFVPDAATGKPHFQLGMIGALSVK